MFSREVKTVLHRSFALAHRLNHRSVTLEHLVLEMLAEPPIVDRLLELSVDVYAIRDNLRLALKKLDAGTGDDDQDAQPTGELQGVMHEAILDARAACHLQVSLLDLLAVVLKTRGDLAAGR
jgi:ATP-dependent Clp protease ATP-binding subunit ClpA